MRAATSLDFSEKETEWVIFNNYWLTVDSAGYLTNHPTIRGEVKHSRHAEERAGLPLSCVRVCSSKLLVWRLQRLW